MIAAMVTAPDGFESVFRFLEISSFIVAILSFVGGSIAVLVKMGRMGGRFEQSIGAQAKEITELKKAVESIVTLMIQQTRIEGRIDRLADTVMATGTRLDELTTRVNRFVDNRTLDAVQR